MKRVVLLVVLDNFSHPENIFCALGMRILAGAVLPVHVEIWFNIVALIHDLPKDYSARILIEKFVGQPYYFTNDHWSQIARCHNTFEKQGMLGVVKVKCPMMPDAHLVQKYVDVVMRAVRRDRGCSGPPLVNYCMRKSSQRFSRNSRNFSRGTGYT